MGVNRVIRRFTFLLFAGTLISIVAPVSAAVTIGGSNQADMRIDQTESGQVVDALIDELNQHYVFPETAAKLEKVLRGHQRHGEYDQINSAKDLADLLSKQMQTESNDRHLSVMYSEEAIPEDSVDNKPLKEERLAELANLKSHNFGVTRAERLPANIGYLELEMFAPAKDASDTIAAAMTMIANTDVLIIDLRKNFGGSAETVPLVASYLLDERTHLNDLYFRDDNRLEQMWSAGNVSGARFGQEKDVYVLTSGRTFSAAEDFCYSLQSLKRITLVGEATGGAAHPGGFLRLHPHFSVFIPNGRAINPITKTDWEGVGVTPDVASTAKDALKTAQTLALNKILAATDNLGKAEQIKARIAAIQSDNAQ
jgi:hypothetical protein